MINPLFNTQELPAFDNIQPDHVVPAIDETLAKQRAALEALLSQANFNWKGLIEPLEALEETLSRTWSPVGHLNMVMNSDELREAHDACLPKLSDFHTEIGQNQQLYAAIQSIRDSAEFDSLDSAQQKLITDTLRDFQLSGVAWADDNKARD